MSTPLLQQFPSLSSYPPSFLKDLLSSPELTEAFLFTLPEIQQLAAEVEKLGRENEDAARRNLELKDELSALRDATAQSYAHAEDLKRQWADIEKAQQNLYQRVRPSFLHLRLRHSLTAQDELSEKIASAFIEDKSATNSRPGSRIDSPAPSTEGLPLDRAQGRAIEDFIQEFKAARKVYHKRAIWAERWSRGEVAWRDD
ncbi:hypothetical protein I307_01309 [Cryptococcus deuterogattii 99/473]|uniref:VPS37 C-terminal domain-containing protein n=2 Tax=Cryptococcus deuterogattii TaxID=1859096 RepID=A0A0D0T163_9TREE|nr:hypothetical protein CNBG_4025 [Cryptococcus deuterogattii R265]KIR29405.1 hypothetical protein I309_01469 [Cryptococcus deuterogattii LA55]KIR34632.1 hypothetical protein I352_02883 [Cryptococcus deuterogattii MMRL2647]KIR39432.1 hypothetical protein I313_04453 [Cryptococcus deuterogattii Ram5]KIR73767.1 hypothetical protein I310_02440 [Cryptococcus deuterogattii CA1014]KIR93259.1 hypothetical protein I304_02923 [Cryptococcus deuterogattii CBS 10090]KIY59062.1 hypothetical protein I307_01